MFAIVAAAALFVGCASHNGTRTAGPVAPRPLPEDVQGLSGKTWVSSDGSQFPFTRWASKSSPTRLVVAVHGLSGAASDFEPLGKFLKERSTTVYSYALRGQGNDPRKDRIGDIRRPELWYADLDAFLDLVRAEHPGVPLFLYGESLGGLISVHGLRTLDRVNRESIHGVILSSPVVSLKDLDALPRVRYIALKAVIRLLPHRMISLEKLAEGKDDMQITGDAEHRENLRNTPHAVEEYSFRLLGTLERLINDSRERATVIRKPMLVLYPGHDLLTTPEDVEAWFAALKTKDKERHLFEKSYHMLLHDSQREEVLEVVGGWLERH
jgi:alpha-beta hydrolase superfamily lysophospholipase